MNLIFKVILFLNDYSGVIGIISTVGIYLFLAYNNQEKDDIPIEIKFKSNVDSSTKFEDDIIVGSSIELYDKEEQEFTSDYFISAIDKSITNIRAYSYEYNHNKSEYVIGEEFSIMKEFLTVKPGEYIKITTIVPEIYTKYGIKFKINGYETGYDFTSQGKNAAVPKYLAGRQNLLGIIKFKLMN